MLETMNRLMTLFGGVTGLVVAAGVALVLFVLLGGLFIVAGIVLAALLVGAGIYGLVTGRRPFTVRTARFDDVRIFRVDPTAPDERDMIDVTPPKGPQHRSGA